MSSLSQVTLNSSSLAFTITPYGSSLFLIRAPYDRIQTIRKIRVTNRSGIMKNHMGYIVKAEEA